MKCVRRGMYLVLIFLILPLYAEQAEFLIIENPAALTVYNRYEQRLSENDKSIFPCRM